MEINIDSEQIKQLCIKIGNGSHELRNYFALHKKADIPEIQAIDNLAGQIENQARQLVQISQVPANLLKIDSGKQVLRTIYRTNNFFLRSLKDYKQLEYEMLPEKDLKEVSEIINIQQMLIKEIDDQLNQCFLNYLENSNKQEQNMVNQNLQKALQKYDDLDYSKPLDFTKYFDDQSLQQLIELAKKGCNRAHNIQNNICIYQTIESVKGQANQINNQAGNIENQFRAILLGVQQQTTNIAQLKKNIQNNLKSSEDSIKIINEQCKVIENQYVKEMKVIYDICEQINIALGFFQQIVEHDQLEQIIINGQKLLKVK